MTTDALYDTPAESFDEHDFAQRDDQGLDDVPEAQSNGYDDLTGSPEADQAYDEPEPTPSPEPLNTLPLDLTLRCGELRLTLGELQRLGNGSVLEVHGIAPGHATLCHGDRVLAEGELVDVDGRLGLQITRMAAQPC